MMNLVLIYSSLILSFMAAVYWGMALNQMHEYNCIKNIKPGHLFILSIVLFIFGLLFFVFEQKEGVLLLLLGFTLCQMIDEYIYFKINKMNWYIILRRFLTLIVVSTLIYCYINLR